MTLDCRITIADSWFFREARAHDAIGAGQIDSMFPPPVSTLSGALRTVLGDWMDVDWQAFSLGKASEEVHKLLGSGEDLGSLKLRGPYITSTNSGEAKHFYPAPAALLGSSMAMQAGASSAQTTLHRLSIGAPIQCDKGMLAMPDFDNSTPAGAQPLTNHWISASGLFQWLSGETPQASEVLSLNDIIEYESRLGIARDNHKATVHEGLLYQTRHIRLKQQHIGISLQLDGLSEQMEKELIHYQTSLRLGAEGREAGLSLSPFKQVGKPALTQCKAAGITLYLATPALITDAPLPGFIPINNDAGRVCCWEGKICDVALRLVSAATHRQQRLGGWDMKAHAPKPLRSLIAAGSVFYCELCNNEEPVADAIKQLSGCKIGDMQAHGFGELYAGYWPATEHP